MAEMGEKGFAIAALKRREPLLWINPELAPSQKVLTGLPLGGRHIKAAEARLRWFAPLLSHLFPELKSSGGIIESALVPVPAMQAAMERYGKEARSGRLWIKADCDLPVAGSVKARGGIYEVLLFAETLAREKGLLNSGQTAIRLGEPDVRDVFAGYIVAVGSTGNLGLAIGTMAAALGFKAVVHMSADAKAWKKRRLRDRGVTVVEHDADYGSAVRAGRDQAAGDPNTYFVDDEDSEALFLGYSVAALRLQTQLAEQNREVDGDHPLFVYLPCGVGGAPGGIAFGLKHVFGDDVHCFFAEPVQAPCVLLAMTAGPDLSVYDMGLTVDTEADGLAVGQASKLVTGLMRHLVSGIFTVDDDDLFRYLTFLYREEQIRIEPSAAAGFAGPDFLLNSSRGKSYLQRHQLNDRLDQATHLVWTTGGRLVPDDAFAGFLHRGNALI
ncbi:MAG: D-serine ammonia-lyase [Desulfobacterales bacterium]|nr:D-serine ammonia-lyase [Desulfobacterales bacterium]